MNELNHCHTTKMKPLIHTILLAILWISPIPFSHAHPPSIQNNQKIMALWIDVRTPAEHQDGHLSGSINIPVDEIAEKIAKVAPNKTTQIHLYCRSGRRVEHAKSILQQLGYRNVINHGGYETLRQQGNR